MLSFDTIHPSGYFRIPEPGDYLKRPLKNDHDE